MHSRAAATSPRVSRPDGSEASFGAGASGFTLIEMAIAMVIIGTLLVVVLQGRALIANAEYKSFRAQLSEYRNAFHTFRDRYNALPGDFTEASSRLGLDTGSDGSGNGVIDGGSDCSSSNDEGCSAWAHLRAAGLTKGASNAGPPDHSYADQFAGFFTGDGGNDVFGHKLRVNGVPVEIARRLDNDIDDGLCDEGRVSSWASGDCTDGDWDADTGVDIVYRL